MQSVSQDDSNRCIRQADAVVEPAVSERLFESLISLHTAMGFCGSDLSNDLDAYACFLEARAGGTPHGEEDNSLADLDRRGLRRLTDRMRRGIATVHPAAHGPRELQIERRRHDDADQSQVQRPQRPSV